ncbi:uncharacterized protein EI90DRAFT_3117765 [Cantharellus anzutake]|uniref:uncharacterized protein n=1 Tax=Cantharellus anzutake TaxID=1750568 RepID=UPI0019072D3E|nr:uncharacterized protein EI90DRAFT_3117765 [Cantharellus anzutake]KAF8340009.1 hypothetical protein EI90DRAFT_3117765 [Cantharellus anzutake]
MSFDLHDHRLETATTQQPTFDACISWIQGPSSLPFAPNSFQVSSHLTPKLQILNEPGTKLGDTEFPPSYLIAPPTLLPSITLSLLSYQYKAMASYYSLSPPSSHHHNVDQDDVKSIDSQTTLQLDDFESDYDYDFDTTGSSVASGFVYLGGSPLQRMMPKRMSGRQVRSSFFSDGQYEEEEDEEEWYKNEEDEEEAVRRSESWEYVLGVLENQYSHESQYYDQGLHRHDHFRGFPFLSASGSKTFDVHDEIDHSSPSFGTARPHYDATASSGPTTPTNTTIIQYLSPSSPLARITSYLNQPDIRRDPWNISPPVEISPNPASANEDNEGGASHVFVRERFRAWNDPEPKGLLQVFEFVRQLLEVSIPF